MEGVFPPGEDGGAVASQFAAVAAYGRCLLETPLVRFERLILTDVNEEPDDETRWLHIDISDTRDGFVYDRSYGALVAGRGGGTHLAICSVKPVASARFTGAERGGADFPLDQD